MRIEELDFENNKPDRLPKVHVYFDEDLEEQAICELAGMLRGLMCSIEGWGCISGLDNSFFQGNSPVKLKFKNVENATRFRDRARLYFDEVLIAKSVRKRRR
jgi:hypothetical protein